MNHGAGGELMQEFLSKHITSHFPKMKAEVPLDSMDDSAVVDDMTECEVCKNINYYKDSNIDEKVDDAIDFSVKEEDNSVKENDR